MSNQEPQKQLAAALGRVPSGLFVITARKNGDETGMLASWVQQCSFEPPQVTVVIKRDRPFAAWFADGAAFTINILDDRQTDMIAHFGRGFAQGQPAFEGLEVDRPDGAAPVLAEALAYLTCTVRQRLAVGDHELFVAEVTAGKLLGDGQPMVHVRKSGLHY